MTIIDTRPKRGFTKAAREAALVARRAKLREPDTFGIPTLFVARLGASSFTWEIRRFGGVVLQRGDCEFKSPHAAKMAGEEALAVICASPETPTFQRQNRDRVIFRQSHRPSD